MTDDFLRVLFRSVRDERGDSLRDVCVGTGISPSVLSRFERGLKSRVSGKTQDAIAMYVLGVDSDADSLSFLLAIQEFGSRGGHLVLSSGKNSASVVATCEAGAFFFADMSVAGALSRFVTWWRKEREVLGVE